MQTANETLVSAYPVELPAGRRVHLKVGATVLAVTVYGVLVACCSGPMTLASFLNLTFYVFLMLNTFFSVSFTESTYHLRCFSDEVLNVPLAGFYLAFPWLTRDTFWFHLCMSLFFSVAMMKYANWLSRLDANYFLRRKILANGFGCVLCGGGAAAMLLLQRYELWALIGVIAFGYANVHTLWLDPLYRHTARTR